MHRGPTIVSIKLDEPFYCYAFDVNHIVNGRFVSDDPNEFTMKTITVFRRISGGCQIGGEFVTNEGTFNGFVKLLDVSGEYWVDAMVDTGIQAELIEKEILPKQTQVYLDKLLMQEDYRLRFVDGDHVYCLHGSDEPREVQIVDADPVEYACQLSHPYLISDENGNETWVPEKSVYALDEEAPAYDPSPKYQLLYNVQRAKQNGVRSYMRKNLLNMDELAYDLNRNSVHYNKENEIDLNCELKEGASEILLLNVQFMQSTHVYTYLIPLMDSLNSTTKYEETNIRFKVGSGDFCEEIGVSSRFDKDDGGYNELCGDMIVTWNRNESTVFVTKFTYNVYNRHGAQVNN